MYTLGALNQMSPAEFTQALGEIFEQTPSVAAQAWLQRPFLTVEDLHQCMEAIVLDFATDQKLALIQAHPDLGSKAKMADASIQEQAGVGLDRLTPVEYGEFMALNTAYRQRFGFPFIIAVRYHTQATILEAFAQRLQNSAAAELNQAIVEIGKIAKLRLLDLIRF
jgi:2-oxo-4-hydroxy-4-carboxy-5-ureidoimidazoline decarboxylase